MTGNYYPVFPERPGRKCSICTHKKAGEISVHLALRDMQYPSMAKKYGVSADALRRHRDAHMPEEMRREIVLAHRIERAEAVAVALNEEQIEVDTGMKKIVREIDYILQRAKGNEDDLLALGSLKEMRQALMDLARLQGQLNKTLTVDVNVNDSPQFIRLREMILRVLDRHPDAKADFLGEMSKLQLSHG